MPRVLVVSVLLLFATSGSFPVGAAEQWSESYVTGAGFTLYCSAEEHPILPWGDPFEHHDPISWAVSGEPECAHQDLLNTYRESQGQEPIGGGVGGVAVSYGEEDIGKTLVSTPDDEVSGVNVYHVLRPPVYGYEGAPSVEGCGVLTTALPWPDPHWQWETGQTAILWDIVEPVWAGEDLALCMSSKGSLHYMLVP